MKLWLFALWNTFPRWGWLLLNANQNNKSFLTIFLIRCDRAVLIVFLDSSWCAIFFRLHNETLTTFTTPSYPRALGCTSYIPYSETRYGFISPTINRTTVNWQSDTISSTTFKVAVLETKLNLMLDYDRHETRLLLVHYIVIPATHTTKMNYKKSIYYSSSIMAFLKLKESVITEISK